MGGWPTGVRAGAIFLTAAALGCSGRGSAVERGDGAPSAPPPPPTAVAAPGLPPAPDPAPDPPPGDWPTYHHDAARTGVSPDQLPLGRVRSAWRSEQLDGSIYAEPLVVGDRVIVATLGNTLYSLDAATGEEAWHTSLGPPVPAASLPCGNVDPAGTIGTPVVDVAAGTIYSVAFLREGPRHELFALSLDSGVVRWHRAVDPPGLQATVEQERGALALAGGRVYVAYGGLDGDCGPYRGAVVSLAADGQGALASYLVPTRRMGGIWNPGGPAVDARGDLLVVTGNSASRSVFDYGNAVLRLSPELEVRDYFAPRDWAALNRTDTDLGSTSPILLTSGRVLAVGKAGVAYLLDQDRLGQIGGELSRVQACRASFGAAATVGSLVFVPCIDALVGLRVEGDALAVAWSQPGEAGPAIVAAGAVWSLGRDGQLRARDPASGEVRFTTSLAAPVTRFISPSAARGRLFVADRDRIAAFALR